MIIFKRLPLVLILFCCSVIVHAEKKWNAHWITSADIKNEPNSWICFRKDFNLKKTSEEVIASIAVDSKYWLWINGEMIVFEGGLKRGPSSEDTYYDDVNIAPFLKKGKNSVAVLVWYFGKEGFSHKDSGKAGLLFDCKVRGVSMNSDTTWKAGIHPAFLPFEGVQPNNRLSESSLCFDARKDIGNWVADENVCSSWEPAVIMGTSPCEPWNKLVLRPVPLWKNFGLKEYENKDQLPAVSNGEPIVCELPANLQVTPYLEVETTEGDTINIKTDHLYGGNEPNVQARYITRRGVQEYESLGWMNGEKVIYSIPKGVKIVSLKYRETGFNTEFLGSFICSDPFYNRLWEKSRRTLYVTMRDNYMDCPDRERAQWWGDEVNESGEAFYAFDTKSHTLQKKGMYELINWQRPDSVIFSPVPAGNWSSELPGQMLASVGYYGFWNYYLHTGDLKTIADLYDGVMRYLSVWKVRTDGSLIYRGGDWNWGDWGEQKDMQLIQSAWYYIAIKGAQKMAVELNKNEDAAMLDKKMVSFKNAFNALYWNGKSYRHPDYQGLTDDRVQALAVVSGIAEQSKYPALFEVLKEHEHASPYMEKYVIEALFIMGEDEYALTRMKKRFKRMVDDPDHTTLWEVWGNSDDGFTGGTTNHAWSGGGLTLLSQYVCGIEPIIPGYSTFQVAPQPGGLTSASAVIESVKGQIDVAFEKHNNLFNLSVNVPGQTSALVKLPYGNLDEVRLNGKLIWEHDNVLSKKDALKITFTNQPNQLKVGSGNWTFITTN